MCADVVYVGVIHPYHLSTCLLFTNAKKNVLCEKPLAMNAKEVQQILASAETNGVFLMEVGMEQSPNQPGPASSNVYFMKSLACFAPGRLDSLLPDVCGDQETSGSGGGG